ncbi:MAG TPA: SSI family serine proteinase inhibitor [Amycolatopsis sp.]|uniref:SSI family serine proteinase inhibitor n=1 Tax=Amycolatopsis sp. TaxID=37632 RepID=UPI002B4942E3|nr:SSI family serine proteinase inhibitor [Amycolatopsis sp.]HKS49342.1 SSI family serine proteinase inhibitor [Amycolatopsis sp.]
MRLPIFASVFASVLALLACPAEADPATELTLSVRQGSGSTAEVTLHCQPSSGSHPDPTHACETLSSVDGDFDRLPQQSAVCQLIWDPLDATASGHWRDRAVNFTHTYPNRCLAVADSSGVFAF